MPHQIEIEMKQAHGDAPHGKFLVAWHYQGALIYADVSCGLPPFDDFDTFAHKVEKKLGHRDFYQGTTILYGASLRCDTLPAVKAHKAAADLLIATLAPPGAKRKARAPGDVHLTLTGDWPAWLPATLGGDPAPEAGPRHAELLAERCRGQAPPAALVALLDEHADEGRSLLLHPSTFELDLSEPVAQDSEDVAWIATGGEGFRLGFWLGGGAALADAPLVLETSEGSLISAGRSLEELLVLYASFDGPDRVAEVQAWLGARGLRCARTPEEILGDLPAIG